MSDHDLLIKLNENVSSMREEFRESNKQFNEKSSDHEARLRLVEAANERNEGSMRTLKILTTVGGIIISVADLILLWYAGVHK